MKGIHPNVKRAATCALLAAGFAVGGCHSTSSGIANNPFLAPNRVAPPSTRVLAPGQAQPYYQGDPLPVMQSATAPPNNAVAASANPADALSSSGRSLAWNAPGGIAPSSISTAPKPNTAAPWGVNPPATPIAYANEPAVSVPADSDSLRFALPAPTNPESTMPIAVVPTPTISQPIQPVAAPPNQDVMLASYNAPVATGPTPIANAPLLNSTQQQVTSPWRAPQFAPSSQPTYSTQPYPIQQLGAQPQQYMIPALPANSVPIAMPTNSMAVQLRAVPSPPQPGDPMPRIRMPGYEVPQTATADGFRPRSSMR